MALPVRRPDDIQAPYIRGLVRDPRVGKGGFISAIPMAGAIHGLTVSNDRFFATLTAQEWGELHKDIEKIMGKAVPQDAAGGICEISDKGVGLAVGTKVSYVKGQGFDAAYVKLREKMGSLAVKHRLVPLKTLWNPEVVAPKTPPESAKTLAPHLEFLQETANSRVAHLRPSDPSVALEMLLLSPSDIAHLNLDPASTKRLQYTYICYLEEALKTKGEGFENIQNALAVTRLYTYSGDSWKQFYTPQEHAKMAYEALPHPSQGAMSGVMPIVVAEAPELLAILQPHFEFENELSMQAHQDVEAFMVELTSNQPIDPLQHEAIANAFMRTRTAIDRFPGRDTHQVAPTQSEWGKYSKHFMLELWNALETHQSKQPPHADRALITLIMGKIDLNIPLVRPALIPEPLQQADPPLIADFPPAYAAPYELPEGTEDYVSVRTQADLDALAHPVDLNNRFTSDTPGLSKKRFAFDSNGKPIQAELVGKIRVSGNGPSTAKQVEDRIAMHLKKNLEKWNPDQLTEAGVYNAIQWAFNDLQRTLVDHPEMGCTGNFCLFIGTTCFFITLGRIWPKSTADNSDVFLQADFPTPVKRGELAEEAAAMLPESLPDLALGFHEAKGYLSSSPLVRVFRDVDPRGAGVDIAL